MNVPYPNLSLLVGRNHTASKQRNLLMLLGIVMFLLSGVPKLRIAVGVPLYIVDFIILYLLEKTARKKQIRYSGLSRQLVGLLSLYCVFVVLGELRGGWVYGMPLESAYTLFRVCMAISLTYIIPRQVQNLSELKVVLKGLCAGLLLSALIAILYSLPATRSLTDVLFSIKAIAPDGDRIVGVANAVYDSSFEGNYRGRSLLGASTFSSGVMAMLWPALFMSSTLLPTSRLWNYLSKAALILLPLGILATYGRSAWLSVVLVTVAITIWGSARGRAKLLLCFLLVSLILAPLGIDMLTSKLPLVNRVVKKTQVTIEHGAEKESEAERFLAYVEPFSHVIRHPSFLIAGSGSAQRKWGGNLYGEAESASHAIPGMAYYAYGVGGAVCQIGFIVLLFRLILRRLQQAKRRAPSLAWIWRSLLCCWFGLLPWWCFGHGIVSAPRGAMAFFLFIGIVLACDRIFRSLCAQLERSKSSTSANRLLY